MTVKKNTAPTPSHLACWALHPGVEAITAARKAPAAKFTRKKEENVRTIERLLVLVSAFFFPPNFFNFFKSTLFNIPEDYGESVC